MQITIRREPVALIGKEQFLGVEAPAARVLSSSGDEQIIGMIADKPQIFIALPSLKSEVCSMGARRFDALLVDYQDKIHAYIISADCVDVLSSFECANCITSAKLLSDSKLDFGVKYGIKIGDGILKDGRTAP